MFFIFEVDQGTVHGISTQPVAAAILTQWHQAKTHEWTLNNKMNVRLTDSRAGDAACVLSFA